MLVRKNMYKVKLVLDRESGKAFAENLPEDDAQTSVWMPEAGETMTVEAFAGSVDAARMLRKRWRYILAAAGCEPGVNITIGAAAEKNWSTDWRSHFQTERITDHLVVCPSWDSYVAKPGERVVRIDPGMSFGTGQHATTRACLRFLDECRVMRCGELRFLDIGCGSGILSVAAALMGFKEVTGVDNDPRALSDARKNSARNGVGDRVVCLQADLEGFRRVPGYDVVAANLLADLLIGNADTVVDLVEHRPPGELLAAGMLRGQYAEVLEIYRARGFREIKYIDDGEWRSGWWRNSGRKMR